MIQDKINRINKSVLDKKLTIQKRNAEIEDLELQLKNQKDEVDQVLADKNSSLNEVLDDIQKLNEREINFVVSMSEYQKHEQALFNTISMIIEKDHKLRIMTETCMITIYQKLKSSMIFSKTAKNQIITILVSKI